MILLILGWILILTGLFFIFAGTVGLFRFPDFYTKLHGASVIESCGIPMCLFGLAFIQDSLASSMKLIILIFIVLILNPVSTYALARSSLENKIDEDGRIR